MFCFVCHQAIRCSLEWSYQNLLGLFVRWMPLKVILFEEL